MFNIISFESNYKADFILMKEDDYGIEAFNRRNEMDFYGHKIYWRIVFFPRRVLGVCYTFLQ